MVHRGGVVVCGTGDGAVHSQIAGQGGGLDPNPKLSCCGFVSGCSEAAGGGEGCCGVTAPPHAKLERERMGDEVVWWMVVVVLTC